MVGRRVSCGISGGVVVPGADSESHGCRVCWRGSGDSSNPVWFYYRANLEHTEGPANNPY